MGCCKYKTYPLWLAHAWSYAWHGLTMVNDDWYVHTSRKNITCNTHTWLCITHTRFIYVAVAGKQMIRINSTCTLFTLTYTCHVWPLRQWHIHCSCDLHIHVDEVDKWTYTTDVLKLTMWHITCFTYENVRFRTHVTNDDAHVDINFWSFMIVSIQKPHFGWWFSFPLFQDFQNNICKHWIWHVHTPF